MMLFMNMSAQVTLGKVRLDSVQSFSIEENILEISNAAKVVIPRNWKNFKGEAILDHIKVGDKVAIEAGYDNQLALEFTGYIREIGSDVPLEIYIDDETYPLRQTNLVKSYKDATLKQILMDIIPSSLSFDCPDVKIGKYMIDNASSYAVLQDLMKNYGLYSRLVNGSLRVGLAYDYGDKSANHVYVISGTPENPYTVNVKKNDLKFKRKEDFKVRYKAIANNPNGKKTIVVVGDKSTDASERTLNFPGSMSEAQLKQNAESVMSKTRYDGYSGDITGFGLPRVHAGDSITIRDYLNPEREGRYLVETVSVTFDEDSGFSRKSTLSYKVG